MYRNIEAIERFQNAPLPKFAVGERVLVRGVTDNGLDEEDQDFQLVETVQEGVITAAEYQKNFQWRYMVRIHPFLGGRELTQVSPEDYIRKYPI